MNHTKTRDKNIKVGYTLEKIGRRSKIKKRQIFSNLVVVINIFKGCPNELGKPWAKSAIIKT